MLKNHMTNEELTSLYSDNFQLANQAIIIARRHIDAGYDFSLRSLLDEVKKKPDMIEEEEKMIEEETRSFE